MGKIGRKLLNAADRGLCEFCSLIEPRERNNWNEHHGKVKVELKNAAQREYVRHVVDYRLTHPPKRIKLPQRRIRLVAKKVR